MVKEYYIRSDDAEMSGREVGEQLISVFLTVDKVDNSKRESTKCVTRRRCCSTKVTMRTKIGTFLKNIFTHTFKEKNLNGYL